MSHNLELFQKVRDRIAAVPQSYRQKTFYRESSSSPCGAVACIAGETIICASRTVKQGIEKLRQLDRNRTFLIVADEAQRLLNISNEEANVLFDGSPQYEWPERFASLWGHLPDSEVAIQFLDHIIAGGNILPPKEEG